MNSRPNILLILTDQQHARMLSCAGNPYLKTPAMDSLAQRGVRFERTYCTDPVCVPSRFSLMTGLMPRAIGLRGNVSRHIESIPDDIKENGLGWLMKRAGYDVAYGGKVHLPKMTAEDVGFEYITADERDELPGVCLDYMLRPREKPFFLVASFINPHDICYMAIREFAESDFDHLLLERGEVELATLDKALQLPQGVPEEEFWARYCPPLPPNFEPQEEEPGAIRALLRQRRFRERARAEWSEEKWRLHRWAYARLTEMVDRQIGELLQGLQESRLGEETVVIFTSDHGDMDAAHRMEHKTAFYDEAARVPLIVSSPTGKARGVVDETHLISNGLDLLPTICDYAEAPCPKDLPGRSFRSLVEGQGPASWRTYVPLESEIGRMIVTGRYKYMLFDEGEHREQLFDLQADPYEMRSFAGEADYWHVLLEHRRLFREEWPDVALPEEV